MCSRASILPSRKRARRTSTSRRWSRKACSAAFSPITPRRAAASSTFMLTGKRVSRSESLNRLSISTSGSTLRDLGSSTRRTSSANSSRTSPSSGAFLASIRLGQLFDQVGLLHLVGDLGDDDPVGARGPVSSLVQRARSAHPAAAGLVGLQQRRARLDDDAAGGEVRALAHGPSGRRWWRRAARAAAGRRRSARRRCAAGSRSPCPRRCRTSRWPAGWGSRPAGRPALPPRRRRWRGNRPRPRRCRRAAAAPPSVRRHSV